MAEQIEMFPDLVPVAASPKSHQEQMANLEQLRERKEERDPNSHAGKRRAFMRAGARRAE